MYDVWFFVCLLLTFLPLGLLLFWTHLQYGFIYCTWCFISGEDVGFSIKVQEEVKISHLYI